MERCEYYSTLINQLVDGEVTDSEKSALRDHVKTCGTCRELLMAYQIISMELKDLETPPSGFAKDTMGLVIKKKSRHHRRGFRFRRVLTAAAILVLVTAVSLPGFMKLIEGAVNGDSMPGAEIAAGSEESTAPSAPSTVPAGMQDENAEETAPVQETSSPAPSQSVPDAKVSEAPTGRPVTTQDPSVGTLDTPSPSPAAEQAVFYSVKSGVSVYLGGVENLDAIDGLFNYSGAVSRMNTEPDYRVEVNLEGSKTVYDIWLKEDSVVVYKTGGSGSYLKSTMNPNQFLSFISTL